MKTYTLKEGWGREERSSNHSFSFPFLTLKANEKNLLIYKLILSFTNRPIVCFKTTVIKVSKQEVKKKYFAKIENF